MNDAIVVRKWPKINPVCKYPVWIVATSKTSTTNPMTRRKAMAILKERRYAGQYAELIKAWSCIQGKKLEMSSLYV